MTGDPTTIVVTEDICNVCGSPRINVHHQSFPEMRISGETPDQAMDELVNRLEANAAAVSDPMHRAPVRRAINDIQAFINGSTVLQPKLSEVIQVLEDGASEPGASTGSLVKTGTIEIRRLTLPKERAIPTHQAPGEIAVHCLKGLIEFTASGETRRVGAGQLIVLAAGEPHSLVALEDSTVLVTKVLVVGPSEVREGGRRRDESSTTVTSRAMHRGR